MELSIRNYFLKLGNSVDKDMFVKRGLSPERITRKYALWFFYLILLFCNVQKSGVENDLRMSYYSNVESFACEHA